MSKKVISILLSAAMLVAMFCVGFGALNASAANESTFYFLAPRTEGTNYFATSEDIGFWYWPGTPEGASWPGFKAEAATEIGKDVYKASVPEDATGLIFNAFVDAGDGDTYDAEKAKVAFQTANIEDIEVFGSQDHRNEIYVLDLSTTAGDEKPQTTGKWFSTDSSSDNYYRLSDFYKAYSIENDTATPDAPVKDSDTTSTPSTSKKYSSGSAVTVTYKVHGINDLGSISSVISYNADVIELDSTAFKDKRGNGTWYEKNADLKPNVAINNTDEGVEIGILTEDGEFGSDFSNETTIVTVAFKATSDFNEEDLGITLNTTKFMEITADGSVDITDKAGEYVAIDVTLPEPKQEESSNVGGSSVPSTPSSSQVSSSEKTSDSDAKNTKDPSSDSKNTSSGSTTSTSTTTTTGTTPTVQTAGTFAVISLVVILMAAAGVVIYTRKKTEE